MSSEMGPRKRRKARRKAAHSRMRSMVTGREALSPGVVR